MSLDRLSSTFAASPSKSTAEALAQFIWRQNVRRWRYLKEQLKEKDIYFSWGSVIYDKGDSQISFYLSSSTNRRSFSVIVSIGCSLLSRYLDDEPAIWTPKNECNRPDSG